MHRMTDRDHEVLFRMAASIGRPNYRSLALALAAVVVAFAVGVVAGGIIRLG